MEGLGKYRDLDRQIAEVMGWTGFEVVPVPDYATISGREPYLLGVPPIGGKQDVPRYSTDANWTSFAKVFAKERFGKIRVDLSRATGRDYVDVQIGIVVHGRLEWLPVSSEVTTDHDNDSVKTEGVATCRAIIAACQNRS